MVIKLLLIIALTFIVIVTLHEFAHIITAKCQGYKSFGVKLFFLLFMNKRIFIDLTCGILGAAYTYYGSVDSVESEKKFQRHYKIDILITYLIHLFEMTITLILCFVLKNYYIYAIAGTTWVVSICMFVSAFDTYGDLDLFSRLNSDKSLSAAIIASFEILFGLKNDYIFRRVQYSLLNLEPDNETFLLLTNYYVNYCLYHGIGFKQEILEKVRNKKFSKESDGYTKNFILEKFYLYTFIYDETNIELKHTIVTEYIRKIAYNKELKESDIKLELNHKIYKYSPSYKRIVNDIYLKIKDKQAV